MYMVQRHAVGKRCVLVGPEKRLFAEVVSALETADVLRRLVALQALRHFHLDAHNHHDHRHHHHQQQQQQQQPVPKKL